MSAVKDTPQENGAAPLYLSVIGKKICSYNNSRSRWELASPPSPEKKRKEKAKTNTYVQTSKQLFFSPIASNFHLSHSVVLPSTSLPLQRDGEESGRESAGARWMMIIQAHSLFSFASLH